MRIAIITARGGSKRIPRKNLKLFAGLPMIRHSINAALASSYCDRVIVSTDDPEIRQVAIDSGAEVPSLRPSELSGDMVPMIDVVLYTLDALDQPRNSISEVCVILGSSPLVESAAIDRGYEAIQESKADGSIAVTTFPFPIWRAFRVDEENHLKMIWPENMFRRSQDLEEAFHDVGQFYWARSQALREQRTLYLSRMAPVFIPRYLTQDIDTEEDWKRAEILFQIIARQRQQETQG